MSTAKDKLMPSDRVWEKMRNYADILGGENVEICVYYAEETLDYA